MNSRKVSLDSADRERCRRVSNYLVELAKENNLKVDTGLLDPYRSRNFKDNHADEELIAYGIVLSRRNGRVKVVSADADIYYIAKYVNDNFDKLDKELLGNLKQGVGIYQMSRYGYDVRFNRNMVIMGNHKPKINKAKSE